MPDRSVTDSANSDRSALSASRRDRLALWGLIGLELFVFGLLAYNHGIRMDSTWLLPLGMVSLLLIGLHADRCLVRSARRYQELAAKLQSAPTPAQVDGERRLREQLAQVNQELRMNLETDELTGLYNRRAFDRFTKHCVHSPAFVHQPLSFLMMDLDQFKSVNDTYGHAAGDQMLQSLAALWRSKVRASDMIARLGGEEFCVVLPDTNLAQAVMIAEKIRAVTAESPVSILVDGQRQSVPITVSLGVSTADETQGIESHDLLRLADSALYEAKHGGGNRVMKRRYN